MINTAGFLASTNDIRNDDFMAGRIEFQHPRPSRRVDRQSRHHHGVEPWLRRAGRAWRAQQRYHHARLGTVALASGNSFTLDMYGDKLIQLAVGDEIANKVIDVATGKPLPRWSATRARSANGGRVELTAAAARQVVNSVINNTGVIEANSIGTRNGKIVLGGPRLRPKSRACRSKPSKSPAGSTRQQDRGPRRHHPDHRRGHPIPPRDARCLGHAGGGKILVGGDYGGGRPIPAGSTITRPAGSHRIPTATTVTVDAATSFNASATANGHGGKVILWSDMATTFAGTDLGARRRARRQRRLCGGVGEAAACLHRTRRSAARTARPARCCSTARVGILAGTNSGLIENVMLIGGSVSNLQAGGSTGGLVGWNNGTIRNDVSLQNVSLMAGAANQRLGILAGQRRLGLIENVTISGGTVSGGSHNGLAAGGLAGWNEGSILNSTSSSAVGGTGLGSSFGGRRFNEHRDDLEFVGKWRRRRARNRACGRLQRRAVAERLCGRSCRHEPR